jgi:dihydroflavonol-4-reductase
MTTLLEIERPATRYIVGGPSLTVSEIMAEVARVGGRRPPRAIPGALALAVAYCSEGWARLTGGRPTVPIEGVRIFLGDAAVSSARAEQDLGARFRPFGETVEAVVDWYRRADLLPR